uniref:helix-turn-helix domain-containing protein n=1 Tax=Acetatifactor sp. TaxID=1872090 RepID=UPI0040571696
MARLRKERELTQKEISEKLCISEKTVSKWECGNKMPEVAYIEPLCNLLEYC